MDKQGWKKKIIKTAKDAGTYQKYFEPVIDTLADILSKRDAAQELFERSGSSILINHTNKLGARNLEQNPLLRAINDLNRDALTYWKEMGLTAASLRRINEQAMEKKKESALITALKEFK